MHRKHKKALGMCTTDVATFPLKAQSTLCFSQSENSFPKRPKQQGGLNTPKTARKILCLLPFWPRGDKKTSNSDGSCVVHVEQCLFMAVQTTLVHQKKQTRWFVLSKVLKPKVLKPRSVPQTRCDPLHQLDGRSGLKITPLL